MALTAVDRLRAQIRNYRLDHGHGPERITVPRDMFEEYRAYLYTLRKEMNSHSVEPTTSPGEMMEIATANVLNWNGTGATKIYPLDLTSPLKGS